MTRKPLGQGCSDDGEEGGGEELGERRRAEKEKGVKEKPKDKYKVDLGPSALFIFPNYSLRFSSFPIP